VAAWALDVLRARVAEDPRFAPHLVTVLLTDDRQDEAWSVVLIHTDQLGEAQFVDLLTLRGGTRPQDVVQPYRALVERHLLDSRDKWRYERALKLLTPLRAAHLSLGDNAGWTQYLDGLRDDIGSDPPSNTSWTPGRSRRTPGPRPAAERHEISRRAPL
jgi:hypothetical protein